MSDVVIQVDHLWKKYRLGVLGTGTLRHDFNRWLHRITGKPDPYEKVGENQKAGSEQGSQFQHSAFPTSALSTDAIWALRDISFEVKQGEILGIIGRNGAGKSTLLKILSRVTAPTSGEVRAKGRIASLLEVGTGFHPELTGRENIFLNGAILGMTKAEIKGKLDEVVAFAAIEKFLDTPVKRYSSGMYVRLAFAVAAHLEPEILIVDEVLAVGDAEFQKKCLGKMKDVASEGRTVLFVSHNMAAIARLTTFCILVSQGSIRSQGLPSEAIHTYLGKSGETQPSAYDVTKTPRLFPGTNEARFLTLSFSRAIPVFAFDEDIEFTARISSESNIPELRLSMTICSLDGNPVGTTYSAERIAVQKSALRTLYIRLPTPRLAKGDYYCNIAIGVGNYAEGQVDYDVITETLHFGVAADRGIPSESIYWNKGWGQVVLPDLHIK